MLTDAKIAAIKPPKTGQQEYPDNKVTGLRLRVSAGGKKAWNVRRRVGDKIINRKIGSYPAMGLASARKAADRLIASLEREGDAAALDRTFGDAATRWIEKVAKPKNKRWESQQRMLELHVYPAWERKRLDSIKKADVRELLDGIEGNVVPNRVLALVRPIFRYALENDWIALSPAEGITKPRAEKPRDRVLTMEEVVRIWEAAPLLGYPFGPYIRVLILTAQRRAEVASMVRSELNMADAEWHLGSDDAKPGRANLVPLSKPAVAAISECPDLGAYVFTQTGKSPVSGFAKAKRRLDEYLSAKGGPLEPWRLHDIRRSAATHMVRLGISETVVGRVLNHAPKGVTAQVYALHSYAPEKRHALDTWAAEIARATGATEGSNVVQING